MESVRDGRDIFSGFGQESGVGFCVKGIVRVVEDLKKALEDMDGISADEGPFA